MRRKTTQVLTSDVNVTLHQTNDLLAKVNVLTDDLNQKVATIDPIFTAVADLSESVSDLNDQARQLSVKVVSAGENSESLYRIKSDWIVSSKLACKWRIKEVSGTFIWFINWCDFRLLHTSFINRARKESH